MDVPKSQGEIQAKRRRKRMAMGTAALAIGVLLYGVSRIGARVPDVDVRGLWIDTR